MFIRGSMAVLGAVLVWSGCVDSGVGGGSIAQGKRLMTGKVSVNESSQNDEDIFVWLEGFNIGTRTGSDGRFSITLPPASGQSATGGVSGVFRIYFYVSNFDVRSEEVLVQDGEFVYSSGALNNNGSLSATAILVKYLDISTQVAPARLRSNSDATITITTILRAAADSTVVTLHNAVPEARFFGAAFLRNIDTGTIFTIRGAQSDEVEVRVMNDQTSLRRTLPFSLLTQPLPPGKYEVIPFLSSRHDPVPAGLLGSLGVNPALVSPNFLRIPAKRNMAILEITQ